METMISGGAPAMAPDMDMAPAPAPAAAAAAGITLAELATHGADAADIWIGIDGVVRL